MATEKNYDGAAKYNPLSVAQWPGFAAKNAAKNASPEDLAVAARMTADRKADTSRITAAAREASMLGHGTEAWQRVEDMKANFAAKWNVTAAQLPPDSVDLRLTPSSSPPTYRSPPTIQPG